MLSNTRGLWVYRLRTVPLSVRFALLMVLLHGRPASAQPFGAAGMSSPCCSVAQAATSVSPARNPVAPETVSWWDTAWRFRTVVSRPTPDRETTRRPVEVCADLAVLLARAGIPGRFDPHSVRVVERDAKGGAREVPFAWRNEVDPEHRGGHTYLAWWAQPLAGRCGTAEIYFDTIDRATAKPDYDPRSLPPENLLANPSFEEAAGELPKAWEIRPETLVRLEHAAHSHLHRSLKVLLDEHSPPMKEPTVVVSQRVDVRNYAGQEIVFECDLLAERAAYGAPVCIELRQFRGDGSQIPEFAVQPRWLSIELAQGQLVQFRQRGRLNQEATTVEVAARVRCAVRDADNRARLEGPESYFTVWMDRFVLRPGERWPWPEASAGGFVEGALSDAPLNRAFHFARQRRLAFNGASEGTLTSGRENPDPRSVHWGLAAGTLEFWFRPSWRANDGQEHVFFEAVSYGHRVQSRLAKLGADGKNQLEWRIVDSAQKTHKLRAPAELEPGRWYHIAATWDFPKGEAQLFIDGKLAARLGPSNEPWPSSLVEKGTAPGIGISEIDSRSMPMQAFLGGDPKCTASLSAEAVLDEFRISDVARYDSDFAPTRREFAVDEHTRALFHLDGERNGVHAGDDRFVAGHLACELPGQGEQAELETLVEGQLQRRMVCVQAAVAEDLFQANRAEHRLVVTRPHRELPDPRQVAIQHCQHEWLVRGPEGGQLEVAGDYEPWMESITYELAPGAKATLVPHLRANGAVLPFSAESLRATLASGATDDADRAFQAFSYALATTNYYDAHYCETLPTRHRPRVSYTLIKGLNIYPFDQCGPLNHMLRKLFLSVGISSSDSSGTHHQFQQAFYKGSWRLFDLSPRKYWLNRDNTTVCSRETFEDDLYLKLRQGSEVCSALPGRRCRAPFGTAERPHNMDFPLRPGEQISFCWHNEGRWFELTEKREPIPLAKIPPYFGNGAIVYQPTTEGDAAKWANITPAVRESHTLLKAEDSSKAATMIYRLRCPYILSDARLRADYEKAEPGAVRLAMSFDEGKSWSEVWKSAERQGRIDQGFLPEVSARYGYWLKLVIDGRAAIRNLRLRTTFVASPLALPGKLSLGTNRVAFVAPEGIGPVRVVCRWSQRRKSSAPLSTNTLSYYLDSGRAQRNLVVAAPNTTVPLEIVGREADAAHRVSLTGLTPGWRAGSPSTTRDGTIRLPLEAPIDAEGQVAACEVLLGDGQRRLPVQILLAESALVREAERADRIGGQAGVYSDGAISQGRGVRFAGEGQLAFDLTVPRAATYALWFRARWEDGSDTAMRLTLGSSPPRKLSAAAMIGFSNWIDPNRAHTKMFAHFGEQFGHWSWYRVPEVRLAAGKQTMTLVAKAGACLDALLLLPQTDEMDRAAMNLFQNWNFAPWSNPL